MTQCPACGKSLPAGDYRFCPWCAASLAEPMTGQRKTVSILFCDLVESTALGSRLDPEVLRGVLEQYWSRARTVVEAHGGTVEKFIGDAVFGVFGIPTLHDDDALRAVRAAHDLVDAVRGLNADVLQSRGVTLEVRIGVNTGEVVGGTGGDTLMSGDAGNVAARLQSSARPGEVLLGEPTFRLVRDAVEVQIVDPLTVKGKDLPLVAYRLVSVSPASDGQVRRRRFSTRIVGRDRQLLLGEAMFATVVEESCCAMLTVLGEPGVGKSRTVEEIVARIGNRAAVLTGRCLPYGDGIAYWPVAEMLRGVEGACGRSWEDVVAGVDHGEEVLTGLGGVVGRPSASSPAQVAWAFRKLVEALATERPVVLVVDDVQWADPVLLDLLDHLTDLSRGAPVLLISMARPEFVGERPTWGAQRTHAAITTLPSLSGAECTAMARALFGGSVDEQVALRISESADGVPLFVEEMAAMLVDDGHLVSDGSHGWVATTDITAVAVPATVALLVAARLDRLPTDQRAVIDAACVIGKTFYPEALGHLVGTSDDLSPALESLVRSDLVAPSTTDLPGHEAYAFAHLLTADTAYQLMPKSRRVVLHERAAGWWREAAPEAFGREVLAWHLEQAALYRGELGDPDPKLAEEAARLLMALANENCRTSNAPTAIPQTARAVALLTEPSRLAAEAWLLRARASQWTGDFPHALSCATEAGRVAERATDSGAVWRARVVAAGIRSWSDPATVAVDTIALSNDAIDALTPLDYYAGISDAYALRSSTFNGLGRIREAMADSREALRQADLARRAGDLFAADLGFTVVGAWYIDSTPDELARSLDEIAAQLGDEPGIAHEIVIARHWIRMAGGDVGSVEPILADRAQLLVDQGSLAGAASVLSNGVGVCRAWSGDLQGAVGAFAAAEVLRERTGEVGNRSTILADEARLLALLGRDDEARSVLARSRAISAEDDLINEIRYAAIEGLLHARQGEAEESERCFERALGVAASTEFFLTETETWDDRSIARELLGDREGALACAQQALARWELKQFVPPLLLARTRVTALGGA